LIPERVVTYTSVTSRVPRSFENDYGTFEYRHVKRAAFFGYRAQDMQGQKVLLADPAKTLLDFWHLASGPWTVVRMTEMRFQNFDVVDREVLGEYAGRFDSPRLLRAAAVWCELAEVEQEGGAEL
jgi:predicted transcriptional regulator of viral defense system